MAAPTVEFRVRSQKAKEGLDRIRAEMRKARQDAERTQEAFNKIGGGRGTAKAAREQAEAQQRVSRSARSAASSVSRAERELLTLKSTLGGAERASAQYARAQQRLERAQEAGLVSTREAARLQRLMAQRFSTSEVKSRDLRNNMRGLRDSISRLGRGTSNTIGIFTKFRGVLLGVGAALGAFQLGRVVTSSLRAADAIDKAAQTAQIGVEPLQELRFAFQQLGVEQRQLDPSLRRFNRRLGLAQQQARGAAGGSKEFVDAFGAIGVSLRQDTGPALQQTLRQLAGIEDDARRAALASRVFGEDAGPQIAGALSEGIGAVRRLRQEAQQLGIVMSEDLIDQAVDARDSMVALGSVLRARVTKAVAQLAPQLDSLFKGVLESLPELIARTELFAESLGLIDDLSVRAKLTRIGDTLRDLRKEFADTGRGFPRFGPEGVIQNRQQLLDDITRLAREAGKLTGDLDPLGRMFIETSERAAGLTQRSDALGNALGGAGDDARSAAGGFDQLSASFITLETRATSAASRVRELRRLTGERFLPGGGRLPGAPGPTIDALQAVREASDQDGTRNRQPSPASVQARLALAGLGPIKEQEVEAGTGLQAGSGRFARPDQERRDREAMIGATRALTKELRAQREAAALVDRGFDRIEDSATRAFTRGEDAAVSFRRTALGVVEDVSRALFKLAVSNPIKNALTGGSAPTIGKVLGAAGGLLGGIGGFGSGASAFGAGSVLGGFFGAGGQVASTLAAPPLPGFAHGGRFTVGSDFPRLTSAGLDNRLVAFRARDNETVTVTPPGRGGGRRGGSIRPQFNITIGSIGQNVSPDEARQIATQVAVEINRQSFPLLKQATINDVFETQKRNV